MVEESKLENQSGVDAGLVAMFLKMSPENIARLLTFLISVDAIHRRPDNRVIEPKEDELSETGHAH